MLARSIASFAIAAGDTIVIGFFRTMSDNVAKQMKGFKRKLPSRRRHLSLARADTVRHKSGISNAAGFDNVRSKRDAKIKSKQRRRTTVRKSLRIAYRAIVFWTHHLEKFP